MLLLLWPHIQNLLNIIYDNFLKKAEDVGKKQCPTLVKHYSIKSLICLFPPGDVTQVHGYWTGQGPLALLLTSGYAKNTRQLYI